MPVDEDPDCCCCCDFCTPEKSELTPCPTIQIDVVSITDDYVVSTEDVCTAIVDTINWKELFMYVEITNSTDQTVEVSISDIFLDVDDCMDYYFDWGVDIQTVCLDPQCDAKLTVRVYVQSKTGDDGELYCCKYKPAVRYYVYPCHEDQEAPELYTSPHNTHALGSLSCSGEPSFEDETEAYISGVECLDGNYAYWDKLTGALDTCSGSIPNCRTPIVEVDVYSENMNWFEAYIGDPESKSWIADYEMDISSGWNSIIFAWCPDESWNLDDLYLAYWPGYGCYDNECDISYIVRMLRVTCSPCCCCDDIIPNVVTSGFWSMDWESPQCSYASETVDLVVCLDEGTGTRSININIPYDNDLPCYVQYDITYTTDTPGVELVAMNDPSGVWNPNTSGTFLCSGTLQIDSGVTIEGLDDCEDCDPLDNERQVVIKVNISWVVCECSPGLGIYGRCTEACP